MSPASFMVADASTAEGFGELLLRPTPIRDDFDEGHCPSVEVAALHADPAAGGLLLMTLSTPLILDLRSGDCEEL